MILKIKHAITMRASQSPTDCIGVGCLLVFFLGFRFLVPLRLIAMPVHLCCKTRSFFLKTSLLIQKVSALRQISGLKFG